MDGNNNHEAENNARKASLTLNFEKENNGRGMQAKQGGDPQWNEV